MCELGLHSTVNEVGASFLGCTLFVSKSGRESGLLQCIVCLGVQKRSITAVMEQQSRGEGRSVGGGGLDSRDSEFKNVQWREREPTSRSSPGGRLRGG